jgi:SNF2 family DNA or RNA helicase
MAKNLEMCLKIQNHSKKFNIAIADEAHMLKALDSKRSKVCIPLLKNCKRAFVLSGTPAVSNPYEIYNLLHIVRPDLFQKCNQKEFGLRYSNAEFNFFARNFIFKGSRNEKECHAILKNFMIRRLKKQVLHDLPDKRRTKIKVPISESVKTKIKELREKMMK